MFRRRRCYPCTIRRKKTQIHGAYSCSHRAGETLAVPARHRAIIRSLLLTFGAAPGRMQGTTESSTGDDRDEYLARTMQRTAVAAKRDPKRQRKSPSSRAPKPAVGPSPEGETPHRPRSRRRRVLQTGASDARYSVDASCQRAGRPAAVAVQPRSRATRPRRTGVVPRAAHRSSPVDDGAAVFVVSGTARAASPSVAATRRRQRTPEVSRIMDRSTPPSLRTDRSRPNRRPKRWSQPHGPLKQLKRAFA